MVLGHLPRAAILRGSLFAQPAALQALSGVAHRPSIALVRHPSLPTKLFKNQPECKRNTTQTTNPV